MKCSFTREGVYINSDGQHDAHVAIIGNGVEIALNDAKTYQGKSPCPLGLRIEADKCYLQVRQPDGEIKMHDVPVNAVHTAITNLLFYLKGVAS